LNLKKKPSNDEPVRPKNFVARVELRKMKPNWIVPEKPDNEAKKVLSQNQVIHKRVNKRGQYTAQHEAS